MSRYERFTDLSQRAEEEIKIGGDSAKGLVLAILALAEAVKLNEPTERLEISGSLTVDS